jgi:hypothetical protein
MDLLKDLLSIGAQINEVLDDDEHDENWAKRQAIVKKLQDALTSKAWKPKKAAIDVWMFGGGPVPKDGDLLIMQEIAKLHGYHFEEDHRDEEKFISFFKAIGLTRDDALFVLNEA